MDEKKKVEKIEVKSLRRRGSARTMGVKRGVELEMRGEVEYGGKRGVGLMGRRGLEDSRPRPSKVKWKILEGGVGIEVEGSFFGEEGRGSGVGVEVLVDGPGGSLLHFERTLRMGWVVTDAQGVAV